MLGEGNYIYVQPYLQMIDTIEGIGSKFFLGFS